MRGTHRINTFFRKKLTAKFRQQYTGSPEITLLCNNCTGSMMLHDIGIKFNSPFVNLWIEPLDFLEICQNPEEFLLHHELQEAKSELPYPVATINGKKIYLQHYTSFTQAKEIWERRIARMNFAQLHVVTVSRDDNTPLIQQEFSKILNLRKVLLQPTGYSQIEDSLSLPKSSNSANTLPVLTDYCGLFGKRYYDEFDFVNWLNGNPPSINKNF